MGRGSLRPEPRPVFSPRAGHRSARSRCFRQRQCPPRARGAFGHEVGSRAQAPGLGQRQRLLD
eukprot:14106506-Alexandrium_andersonii.AAC.1